MTLEPTSGEMWVHGALIMGYARACMNLNIVAGRRAAELISGIEIERWYPLSRWRELERMVLQSYKNAAPIMLKVGMEMMVNWYHRGPGRQLIQGGASFLHFQTGSNGFQSVVRGSPENVGSFDLLSFDEHAGRAVIRSTTPFDRKMECGVLIGGVLAPGDIDYVDVTNDSDPDLLVVEFH